MRRMLIALAVAAGLFAMHGLAAPSVHAAQCGAAVAHEHVAPASDEPVGMAGLSAPAPTGGDDGLLLACVAILAGLALVSAAHRLARRIETAPRSALSGPLRTGAGRSPPQRRPEDLCVWRT